MDDGTNRRPQLIFDGDCGFCRYWVRYWERLTGPRVQYVASQVMADRHPDIPEEEFAGSIQWIGRDGQRSNGAQAAFRVLAEAPHKWLWLWLYQHSPGIAAIAEWCYGFVSRHRVAAARVSRWLWGPELYPDSYAVVIWVFLRLLALIYFAAFASLAVQITALVGSDGILPVSDYLRQSHQQWGASAYWRIPTLFWLDSSDRALQAACWAGMLAAAILTFGIRVRGALVGCYVLYLSLVAAGQRFTEFQWDMFLLESGFLAIFLPFGSRIIVWLYRWLVFRFMFMGGVVKLASGDPAWRDLSALRYHLETQPLPSPLAWTAYQLPDWPLRLATGGVLVIELVVPFCVFLPRNLRLIAAGSFLLLQLAIMLFGSYNFFNLLTIALCVFLLEDHDLRRLLGSRLVARIERRVRPVSEAATRSAAVMAFVVFTVCASLLWLTNTRQRLIEPLYALAKVSAAFGIVNGYGPFAVMTRAREEIIIEGSEDGSNWQPYEFRYKPGALDKPLGWNIPHQPRLDWQMWFAALGDARTFIWFPRFLDKLSAGSPPVLALLKDAPFSDRPPRHLRALLYRYRFATPRIQAATGQVWQRELLGEFPLLR